MSYKIPIRTPTSEIETKFKNTRDKARREFGNNLWEQFRSGEMSKTEVRKSIDEADYSMDFSIEPVAGEPGLPFEENEKFYNRLDPFFIDFNSDCLSFTSDSNCLLELDNLLFAFKAAFRK